MHLLNTSIRTLVTAIAYFAIAPPSAEGSQGAPNPSCGLHTTVDFGTQVVIGQDIMMVWIREAVGTPPRIEVRRHVDGSWPVIQTLTPVAGNSLAWGTAMATDGQTIVIGDFDANWAGFDRTGVVSVYRRQGNSFSLETHLIAPINCTFLMFGGSVAVDKDTLVVARPNNTETCGLTVPPREAYIFKRIGSTWTYVQSVLPPAVGPEPAIFGRSIVVSCDHLFIGSQGRVWQYHFDGSSWQYVGFIDPAGSGSHFGWSMSGAGRFVAIGDPNNSLEGTPIRAVYLYEDTSLPGLHVHRHTVVSPDSPIEYNFGYWVALAGETLLVGGGVKGVVFKKNPDSNAWNFLMELHDPRGGSNFVAAGPNVMAVNFSGTPTCKIYTCSAGVGGFTGCGDGDLDGDGLLDEWETMGIPTGDVQMPRLILDSDGDGQGDANYQHKDIFVEVDAVPGFHPPAESLGKVIDAFDVVSNDLVNNPDGQPGINLHLQLDDWTLPDLVWTKDDFDGDGVPDWPGEFDDLKLTYATGASIPGYFGTESERTLPAATATAIREAKKKAYRYCIFAKSHDPGVTTGGKAELGGNDFYVTLGLWNNGAGGTADQHAGTFMHELGHTLGLRHGGTDDINYKPNYYSVMNYLWQTPKPWILPYQWPLAEGRPGYSPAVMPSLNELELPNCEPVIDLKSPFAGISFPFNSQAHGQPPVIIRRNFEGDVDWTGGECDISGNVAIDLNRFLPSQTPGASTHLSFADWPALIYNFRNDADYVDGVHNTEDGEEELTEELDLELRTILPAYCMGDTNGDGSANVADLLQVISSWGDCLPQCPADIAPPGWPDYQVNVSDLLLVISSWGPCS